ncbi:hypothetical protein BgiBS90_025959 [Biomphalaria glabrata]|nr:hypothetical protein BgiBS90_025959 [Biomphalaria glabrata]
MWRHCFFLFCLGSRFLAGARYLLFSPPVLGTQVKDLLESSLICSYMDPTWLISMTLGCVHLEPTVPSNLFGPSLSRIFRR